MESVHCRRKSATRSESADDLARLLQSRAGIEPITPTLLAAAERLRGLGIMSFNTHRYVRCALTDDRDFPYSNRTCSGRLNIDNHLDENGEDYRCSECGRTVYPFRHRKKQFEELRAKVLPDGVEQFVLAALDECDMRPVDGVPRAWRSNDGLAGVYLCLADYCDHERLMSVQWAQEHPTCYVAVNPRAVARFVDIDWVSKVMLADLIAGRYVLAAVVRELATSDRPYPMPLLATQIYSKGAHRPQVLTGREEGTADVFIVELGAKTVRVNDVIVLAAQARKTLAILRLLAKEYIDDVIQDTPLDEYLCQTPKDLAEALQKTSKSGDVIDDDQVRRTINRFQESVAEKLRRAGIAAEREDIIQTSPNTATEGYRLNPYKVSIRPLVPSARRN